MTEPTIAEERARELLELSSSSVESELELAEAWIRTGQIPGEGERWRVDAVAGAIGALANAYGRLRLWSILTSRHDSVGDRLERDLQTLAALRQEIETKGPQEDEIGRLRAVVSDFRRLQADMRSTRGEESGQ
ncbi:MAG TPA: hypothetical protein VFB58_10255 [Chloroflexota bacterium]|nr:hypothetical protein [Chloroflexota bacterium]